MYEEINERVAAVVSFKNGKALPRSFTWHDREYRVEKITLEHDEREGASLIFCYAVVANGNSYELSFDSHNLTWTLERVWV